MELQKEKENESTTIKTDTTYIKGRKLKLANLILDFIDTFDNKTKPEKK
tara:strand:+ start:292 stop:438 length:147 start_codon:yes stop_codon:yes gene_type:complete